MYRRDTLPNGIRVVTEAVPHVGSASIGFWVQAGSRWEREEEAGITHFLEHMLFKGTERRTARDIAEDLDSVGGRLNAFTDKEATCYYARVLGEHLPLAIDVLSDMLLHSVFNPEELELEKNVILEEIKQRDDDPEELVHDLFAQTFWTDHPLGRPVIGTPETVGATGRDHLLDYMDRWYTPDRIVIAAAGNLDPDEVLDLVARAFGDKTSKDHPSSTAPLRHHPGDHYLARDTEQINLCLGWPGVTQDAEERYALSCLDVAFGGGMSSRLFQEIRENRGLAYSIGSYTMSYAEGGFLTVFAGTSPETQDEVVRISREEAARLVDEGLAPAELERAKNQIKGSLLMGLESMSTRMSRLGKTELYFGRVITVEEVVERIAAVTDEEIRTVARQTLGQPSTLTALGPFAS